MQERTRLNPVLWFVVLALLVPTVGLVAKEKCTAQADAVLMKTTEKENSTVLEFEVGVVAGELCANVHYDLIIEVKSPDEKVKQVVIGREVRLQKGNHQDPVKHKMDKGHTMVGHETKIKSCHVCEG